MGAGESGICIPRVMLRVAAMALGIMALAAVVVVPAAGRGASILHSSASLSARSAVDARLATILSPRQGGLVRRKVAWVVIRTSPDVKRFRVYLNGTPITARFSSPRNGVRTARVPVRRGINRILVDARSDRAREIGHVRFIAAARDSRLVTVQVGRSGGDPTDRARVQLPTRPSYLEVVVNGTPVSQTNDLADGLDGDHGIRPGLNTVQVTAATANGLYDSETKAFTIPVNQPVAAAGPPQGGQAGRPIMLDGGASKAGESGGALTYEWRVITQPDGANAQIRDANTAQPAIIADRPGSYTLQLEVSQQGAPAPSRDEVTVVAESQVDPIGWRLETIPATGDGIKVNGVVAQANGKSASGGNWVRLLILDNRTLEVKLAQSFNLGEESKLSQAIPDENSNQADHELVVLTGAGHRVTLTPSQVATLKSIWKKLGGTLKGFIPVGKNDPGFGGGAWSIVGQPGLSEGTAEQAYGIAAGPGESIGGMNGLLEKDQNNHYHFIFDQYVPFSTNVAPGGGGTTVRIGSTDYRPAGCPVPDFTWSLLHRAPSPKSTTRSSRPRIRAVGPIRRPSGISRPS